MDNEFDFSGFEDVVKNNPFPDDFAHLNFDYSRPDDNGNSIALFPADFGRNDFFDDVKDDGESFDFI